MSDYAKRAADAHVHASYFRKPEAIHPRGEEARNTAEVMALADERRDANRIARDLTACRSELAAIALLMQERGRLLDVGGDNFALVAGAVTEYVLAMELAVIALNERWKDETVEMNRQMAEIRRLRDMVPGEWDKCRDDLEHKLYEREEECRELCARIDRQAEQIGGLTNLLACDDDCHHAPMCVRWEHTADAELVELKGRRCDECAHWDKGNCLLGDRREDAPMWTIDGCTLLCTEPDHYCAAWQAIA
jgi:hypothetical protein